MEPNDPNSVCNVQDHWLIVCGDSEPLLLVILTPYCSLSFRDLTLFLLAFLSLSFLSLILFIRLSPLPPPPHVTSMLSLLPSIRLWWNFRPFCIVMEKKHLLSRETLIKKFTQYLVCKHLPNALSLHTYLKCLCVGKLNKATAPRLPAAPLR